MSMEFNGTEVTAAAPVDPTVAYEIDALLIVRWLLYIMVAYRVLEIFVSTRRVTTKERLNSRYLGAVFDLIAGLTKQEGELLVLTMNNTVINAKISSDGLKQRNSRASPRKSVKFSGSNIYYDPIKYDETEIEEKPIIPVLKTGDRMPTVDGQLIEETLQPEIMEIAQIIDSAGEQKPQKLQNQPEGVKQKPHQQDQPLVASETNLIL